MIGKVGARWRRQERGGPSRLAGAALLFALTCACASRGGGAREAVIIASASPLHTALIQVAVANGYFAAEGLDVTIKDYTTGRKALEAVEAGDAHVGTAADAVVVLATLRGHRVSVLASIASSTHTTGAVAGAGVASPKDLAGRRVGLPRGTIAEFFLDTLLLRHGVERSAVKVVDVQPGGLEDALAAGRIDAAVIWEPYLGLLHRRMGEAGRVFQVEDIYFETHDLLSTPAYLERHPAAAAKVLRALVRAEEHYRERPDEAHHLLASRLRASPADADALLRRFEFSVRLDQSLLVLMEEQARWAIRTEVVPRQPAPSFLEVLAPGPLLSARPEAVGLIR